MKILIVKVSSLGDVVHTMPVVADILRARPDAQIDWLVEESFADLVRLVQGVQNVIPCALRRWRRAPASRQVRREYRTLVQTLRAQGYDRVIDCQGLIKTAWLAARAGSPVTGLGNRTEGAGYEWPARWFYQRSVPIVPHTHVVERSRQLVAAALALPVPRPEPEEIDFGLDSRAAGVALARTGMNLPVPYVVFAHATSRADKQWPTDDWVALGGALAQRGASLVLPWGSAAEREAAQRIAAHFGSVAIIPERLDLQAVVGLLEGAAATVGVDTGLMHISAALRRPTVGLYNFDTIWRTGAYWSPLSVDLGGRRPASGEAVRKALAGWGLL